MKGLATPKHHILCSVHVVKQFKGVSL